MNLALFNGKPSEAFVLADGGCIDDLNGYIETGLVLEDYHLLKRSD